MVPPLTVDGGLPNREELRAIGAYARDHCGGTALSSLFPGLVGAEGTVTSVYTPSTRLENLLRRWTGLAWSTDLCNVTPANALARNGFGIGSLGELLVIAAWTVENGAQANTDNPPVEGDESAAGTKGSPQPASSTLATDAVGRAVRTVVAWAVWERGQDQLDASIDLGLTDPHAPAEVRMATSVITGADLRAWTNSMASEFDPVGAIDAMWSHAQPIHRLIADRRILALESPATLEELGVDQGVTRERIRQIRAEDSRLVDEAVGPPPGISTSNR